MDFSCSPDLVSRRPQMQSCVSRVCRTGLSGVTFQSMTAISEPLCWHVSFSRSRLVPVTLNVKWTECGIHAHLLGPTASYIDWFRCRTRRPALKSITISDFALQTEHGMYFVSMVFGCGFWFWFCYYFLGATSALRQPGK